MTSSIPFLKLNNGNSIPAIGIGCWMGYVGEGLHVAEMVKKALKMGYRHIDTVSDLYDHSHEDNKDASRQQIMVCESAHGRTL